MNKTAVTLAFFALVMLGIVGAIVVMIYRPELIERYVSTIVVILGLATTGAVLFYGLDKQGTQIEVIRKQTNGALAARDAEIRRLTSLLALSDPISGSELHDIGLGEARVAP